MVIADVSHQTYEPRVQTTELMLDITATRLIHLFGSCKPVSNGLRLIGTNRGSFGPLANSPVDTVYTKRREAYTRPHGSVRCFFGAGKGAAGAPSKLLEET